MIAYMSRSSTDSADNQTIIIQTINLNFTLVNYYCPNNVNLNIQNINVKSENFIIVGEDIEDWQEENEAYTN